MKEGEIGLASLDAMQFVQHQVIDPAESSTLYDLLWHRAELYKA